MCQDITKSFDNKREPFSTTKKYVQCANQYSKISS